MHSRDTTERYPVLADEPLEVRHPLRKIGLIAASFAVAILMTGAVAYAGTSYAIHRAESGLRQQRDQFAAELAERRRQRDAEQAAVNRDLCTMVTRLPPDAETDAIRRRYGCGPFVASPPAPEPTPTARTTEKRRTTAARPPYRPVPRPAAAPRPADPRPGAKPTPAPVRSSTPPAPAPAPTGGPVLVCLPLFGCVLGVPVPAEDPSGPPRHRPAGTDGAAPMSCRVTDPHTSPPCSKPNSGA
jgi:hypothetical protein